MPEAYAWRWIGYHLVAAGRGNELRRLLFDFVWLQAKLAATDASALVADCARLPEDEPVHRLGQVFSQAAHILVQDLGQLAAQLWGRMADDDDDIQALLQQAMFHALRPYLCPLTASLRESSAIIRTLAGHMDRVEDVAVTPDGRQAISASGDQTLKVWDLATGAEVRTLQGHTCFVNDLMVTPDGRQAISISDDGTRKVWDLANGRCLVTFLTGEALTAHRWADRSPRAGHLRRRQQSGGRGGGCLGFGRRHAAYMGSWGQPLPARDGGHTGSITGVAITPDGSRAVSASNDNTVQIWDLRVGALLHRLEGHTREVTAVAIADEARLILSVSKDRTFRVWHLETGSFLHAFNYLWEDVRAVDMTPDGKIAISSSDFLIRIWDVAAGKEIRHLHGHNQHVTDVAVTPDGRFVLSSSRDARLGLWDLRVSDPPTPPGKHRGPVRALAVTPDGRLAVSGASDSTVNLWDVAGRVFVCPLQGQAGHPGHSERVRAVAAVPGSDGHCALMGGGDGGLILWGLDSHRAQRLGRQARRRSARAGDPARRIRGILDCRRWHRRGLKSPR